MAQKKITDLTLISSLTDTANFLIDNGIQSYRTTAPQIFDFIRSKLSTTRTITAAGQTLIASNVMILLDPTSASFTQMLPAVASLGAGTVWNFKNIASNTNTVTLDGNSSELIDSAETLVLEAGDAVRLYNNGIKWVIFEANLTVRRSRISAAERMPVGVVLPFAGPRAPSGFLFTDGSALSRTTYAALFAELVTQASVTVTSGSASITGFVSTSEFEIGAPISGAGIPAGATVLTIPNATSITISANATVTGSNVPVVIAPHGVGDGTTTFNLPNPAAGYLRFRGVQSLDAKSFTSGRLGLKYKDLTAKNGLYDSGHTHQQTITNGSGGGSLANQGIQGNNASMNAWQYTLSGAANILGDVETRPATIVFNAIIKF